MAEKFKIISTTQKGKSVIATADIAKNEIIMQENPIVAAQFEWNKQYGYLCCSFCMKPLETAELNVQRLAFNSNLTLPFAECDTINLNETTKCVCGDAFCSVACKNAELMNNHEFYCNQTKEHGKFFELIELFKNMHFPPESFTIMMIIKLFAMIKKNPQQIIEKLSEFCSRSTNEDLSLVHKMILGEKFSQQLSELHSAIVKIFDGDEDLAKYISYDGFVSLVALIGTNSQGIGTSAFANWVHNVSNLKMETDERKSVDNLIDSIYSSFNDTVGEFLNNEGSGLYLKQSKINHACSCNAEINFLDNNHTLKVVALRDIKANEEICISYLDECQLSRSRHSRQKYLLENYLFLCDCEKCESQINDPDVTSDEEEVDSDAEEMDTD